MQRKQTHSDPDSKMCMVCVRGYTYINWVCVAWLAVELRSGSSGATPPTTTTLDNNNGNNTKRKRTSSNWG